MFPMAFCTILLGLFFAERTFAFDRSLSTAHLKLRFDPQDCTITFGESVSLSLLIDGSTITNVCVQFNIDGKEFVQVSPNVTWINANQDFSRNSTPLEVIGLRPGRFIVKPTITPENTVDERRLFVRLKVALSEPLIYISLLIGWTYTVCWCSGYYPQLLLNYRRKSVVGLSFDFLHINIIGHISYAVFNSYMYWDSYTEEEYFNRHPFGLNPVIGNDVGFAFHASIATGYTIVQCYWYENGGNSVSSTARGIIAFLVITIIVSGGAVLMGSIHWLDFLYVLSYIKLITTLVKYFPQAYINYKRQSTEGFAIMNRLLDIAGGLFGILQMVINAWNFGMCALHETRKKYLGPWIMSMLPIRDDGATVLTSINFEIF
ncbi:cystinosin homolog isoform X2 [Toxorhynchites rutilus septentrionalis]|uniref:cystinosin homolog isoform X2 n=1 Tax=Toxorhynchites rutilus septentrionalis TaxID=329112 RepID=UPI00247ACA56|nr:cystinosin homolog isoform X2 [Toxorhynchites rutilus septentrionalis]